jgi:signal transduction histidine kinase
MQGNQSKLHRPDNGPRTISKPNPFGLFIASVAIIFVAETLVMLLLSFLDLPKDFSVAFVDAVLLSLLVVPALYLMLFKPMRETILKLDRSKEMQKRLEEIDQLKSDFISIAAHELCSPVTTIMGYTEMLLDHIDSEPQREYLNVIHRKALSIERIVNDLGIVDRLETGENLQIIPEENDLIETVNHVFNVYQMRFPDIPFHLDLPEQPLILLYDQIRIRQVLDNLLSNAVKYNGSIHDPIEVSVVDQESQVLILVRDEGIGMTKDELSQIYKKFFRAQTDKSVIGGLGLGMAIVKNIVESHNGTIDVVSQRKVGTTVTVALPKSAHSQLQEILACNS